MTNKILIGCASALALFLLLAGVAGYVIYQRFAPLFSSFETPEQLKQPRVLLGDDLFEKRLFIQQKNLGRITSMTYGELDPGPGPELCIVGQTGAVFTDEQGNLKASVTFAKQVETFRGVKVEGINSRIGEIRVVDIDHNQSCEFLVRNLMDKEELINHQGETVWRYSEADQQDSFLNDMNAGDVNGDHRTEYVVAHLGGKGLLLLDDSLKEIWSKPDVHANVVELVDTDGSGRLKILHDDGTHMVLRDAAGNVISDGQTGYYIGHFSVVRWPSKKDRPYALHFSRDVIRLFDFNGKTMKEFQAPLSDKLHRVHGVPVKLRADEPEYFAAVAEFSVFERSVLYIYDSAGSLIYQEVLPGAYEAIASVPLDQTARESILLGGKDEVVEYRMNISASHHSN
jgi:hypothetical protein